MSSHPPSESDQDDFPRSLESDNSKFKIQNSKFCFVCVGAGSGSRFAGDKLAEQLGGETVFAVALRALTAAVPSVPLVVVVAPDRINSWRERLAPGFPGAIFVGGGEQRHESVRAGVLAAAELGAEIVAVHDAARPLVDSRDVTAVVSALGDADGAILVAPVTDTVKKIKADGTVTETVERSELRLAQTPQVFRIASLEGAWTHTGLDGKWSDESSFLERAGFEIRSVVAQHPNPKLTTESDLRLMRCLYEAG